MEYKHEAVQKVADLYARNKDQAGGVSSYWLKAFGPAVPTFLQMLDEDEELLRKIYSIGVELISSLEQDLHIVTREAFINSMENSENGDRKEEDA